MKGTPRSLFLTWANRTAGWWTSTTAAALQAQQRAFLKSLARPTGRAKPKRKRKSRSRRST